MTMRQTLQACARRWPVLLLGLLLTAGAIGLFGAGHEIYRVRTEAVLNEPLEAAPRRILTNNSNSAVPTVHLLAALANNGLPSYHFSGSDAPLYGLGITPRSSVRVNNVGGQWASQVSEPRVIVESIDSTEEGARRRFDATLNNLQTRLTMLQEDMQVPARARMTLQGSPGDPPIEHITPSQPRAYAAIAVAGLFISVGAAQFADRRLPRRPSRKNATVAMN